MGIDRRAEAYARQHAPLFVNRYIAAARSGQSELIPAAIRPSIQAFVHGSAHTSGIDVNAWVYRMLYDERVRTGGDVAVPPEAESAGVKVAKATGSAALGVGGILLKEAFKLSRRGLFR